MLIVPLLTSIKWIMLKKRRSRVLAQRRRYSRIVLRILCVILQLLLLWEPNVERRMEKRRRNHIYPRIDLPRDIMECRNAWLDSWRYGNSDSEWFLSRTDRGFKEVFRMTFDIFLKIHEEIKDRLYEMHHHTTEYWVRRRSRYTKSWQMLAMTIQYLSGASSLD